MHPFWQACLAANRTIHERIRGGLNNAQRHKSTEGAGGDISSGIDLEAEAIFVRHLATFGQIRSEESGRIGEGEHTVILDPIDGSSNILSGFPYYGTSAALVDPQGEIIAACVCNLAAGEIFFKIPGTPALHGDLFAEDFTPYLPAGTPEIGIFERAYAHPDVVRSLSDLGVKFRAPGAVALSLVYSLRAEFFLYVGKYREYDFAAGMLFLEEMERTVNDSCVLVSHDKKLHDQMTERVGAVTGSCEDA